MSDPAQTPPSPSAGAWLTRQMERRSISVQHIAEALSVTEKTVYYWRNDKTTVSEERVPLLAAVLGVSEIEARRGLGYWVPDGTEPPAEDYDVDELRQLRADLNRILDRIQEIQKRW